jgi:3-hydroxybutyryl-CoA dehydratase
VQGYYFEDLSVGQSAEMTRVATVEVTKAFADLSGDHNPLHLDPEYAKTTPFGGVIAHGMLSAAYISAVLGQQLPGAGSVYLNQTLRFRRPIRMGDSVTARVTVKALDAEKGHVTLTTVAEVNGKVAVDGEATVVVARRP